MLAPVNDEVATASGFLLAALRVAPLFAPAAVGAYWTVTLQDFFGPRLAPVQVSAVFAKAAEADRVTVRAPVAPLPWLVSTNVWKATVPESIVP